MIEQMRSRRSYLIGLAIGLVVALNVGGAVAFATLRGSESTEADQVNIDVQGTITERTSSTAPSITLASTTSERVFDNPDPLELPTTSTTAPTSAPTSATDAPTTSRGAGQTTTTRRVTTTRPAVTPAPTAAPTAAPATAAPITAAPATAAPTVAPTAAPKPSISISIPTIPEITIPPLPAPELSLDNEVEVEE